MSVARLPRWDVTPIEIALDLEPPRFANAPGFAFSGPAEPRICLVAAFALTQQLKRIVAAVDRAVPARLPAGLRIAPAKTRFAGWAPRAISIAPMLPLLRMQRRLIAAIEPGLTGATHDEWPAFASEMDGATARYIGDFVTAKTVPSFEPSHAGGDFPETRLRATGITLYRLNRRGTPQSIVSHWGYPSGSRASVPL